MPTYNKIPTRDQWIADCEQACAQSGAPRPGAAALEQMLRQDHVLEVIVDHLQSYDELRPIEKARKEFRKHLIVMYLYEATQYWLKKGDRAARELPRQGPATAGPRVVRFMPGAIAPAVEALGKAAQASLRKYYQWVDEDDMATLRKALVEGGVGVLNTEAAEDNKRLGEGGMVWLARDSERLAYKLRFRGGLAYRVDRPESGLDDPEFPLLSTHEQPTEQGDGMAHFVMDRRGRIYCGYDRARAKAFKFFHSSLVAGEPVQAAGLMRIEGGQVVRITNASGHYRPAGRHMATVLQRLRLYGVNLSQVQVVDQATRRAHSAQDVMNWNDFPRA